MFEDDTNRDTDDTPTPTEDAPATDPRTSPAPSNLTTCRVCSTPFPPDVPVCPNCATPNPALGAHLAGVVNDEDRARAVGEQTKHALRTAERESENNTPENTRRVEPGTSDDAALATDPGGVPARGEDTATDTPTTRRGKKD